MPISSDSSEKVRKWIAALIKARGISVSALAGAIGKSDSWLRKIIYGKISSISPEATTQLALAIGVEPHDILKDAYALSEKEIEQIVQSTRGTIIYLTGSPNNPNKLSPTILAVLGNLQSPDKGMLEFLQSIEQLAGFPLSKESCIALLKDWQIAHPNN